MQIDGNTILIDECLKTGWQLGAEVNGVSMLIPPEGDIRIHWCAQWDRVGYKGKSVAVPHWAAPGKMTDAKRI